jgi:hypothetical protein
MGSDPELTPGAPRHGFQQATPSLPHILKPQAYLLSPVHLLACSRLCRRSTAHLLHGSTALRASARPRPARPPPTLTTRSSTSIIPLWVQYVQYHPRPIHNTRIISVVHFRSSFFVSPIRAIRGSRNSQSKNLKNRPFYPSALVFPFLTSVAISGYQRQKKILFSA